MSETPEPKPPTDFSRYSASLDDISERGTPDPGNLVPGWLPADVERLLITGPSKAGKSWLAHELVFSLGTGLPFLGVYDLEYTKDEYQGDGLFHRVVHSGIAKPLTTVYVQLENSLLSMERRHYAIRVAHGGEVDEDEHRIVGASSKGYLKVLHTAEDNDDRLRALNLFDEEKEVKPFIKYLVSENAQILVLDSAWRTLPGTLNDEPTAKHYTAQLEKIIDEVGLQLLVVIHHSSTKGEGGRSQHRESMGSTFFTSAWHDLNWRVQRGKDGVTSVAFDARDHMLDPQEVRMTTEGSWEELADMSPIGLRNIADQEDWGKLVKRGRGIGFERATHDEVARFTGSSAATISRLIQVLSTMEESEDE